MFLEEIQPVKFILHVYSCLFPISLILKSRKAFEFVRLCMGHAKTIGIHVFLAGSDGIVCAPVHPLPNRWFPCTFAKGICIHALLHAPIEPLPNHWFSCTSAKTIRIHAFCGPRRDLACARRNVAKPLVFMYFCENT